jgi:hypothetical protein
MRQILLGTKNPRKTFSTIWLTRIAIVDDADFDWLRQWEWSKHASGYAWRGYKGDSGMKFEYMHRAILGAVSGVSIDHKNGNKLDNRRVNLRVATTSQNCQNRPKPKHNTSGFKGVSWNNMAKKWVSAITRSGDVNYLGSFSCPIEAALAYNRAAIRLYGEFARLNEIPPVIDLFSRVEVYKEAA